jgi:nitroreductase
MPSASPADRLRPLRQVRQIREFTDEPPAEDELEAILNVARWSGSSGNSQPWRFLVVGDISVIRAVAEAGLNQTRPLRTATAAVAIAMPDDPDRQISYAYDEGRVAERILIGASMLGLGAGIAWVRSDVRAEIGGLLGVPAGGFVRTIMALGHPTEAARRPKSESGRARLPLDEVVLTGPGGTR